jgi:hypothetical protein
MLEARDVPAWYYWAPPAASDLLSTTAGNWMAGPGVPFAYDTHRRGPVWGRSTTS